MLDQVPESIPTHVPLQMKALRTRFPSDEEIIEQWFADRAVMHQLYTEEESSKRR